MQTEMREKSNSYKTFENCIQTKETIFLKQTSSIELPNKRQLKTKNFLEMFGR